MDETSIDRLKNKILEFARKRYDMGMTRFEDYCQINRGTISSIKKKGPSADTLMKIRSKCPEINMNWLLGDEREMILGQDRETAQSGMKTDGIPVLHFSAMADILPGRERINDATETDRCIVPDLSARDADCAIRMDGDSMYPRYNNGDLLAIRIIKDPAFFQWGRVYVVCTVQGCVIKRLFPDPDNTEIIVCRSENTANYPDYKITRHDILGVAVVVGHVGIE